MTTASDALEAVKTRLGAGSGISFPLYWEGEDAPTLSDTPAPFAFIVFTNEGSGKSGPVAYGGGRGRNTYRNSALVEAYTFVPKGWGRQELIDRAEIIASRLRSFRDEDISCFNADVVPIGEGEALAPPGLASEVNQYQCAVAEIALQFDQIG
ncbi:hypothetical protein V1291_000046 [Nitrobacteraceae bacterium AZCC 1564]